MILNNNFTALNDTQLVAINGGECILETLAEHPIKLFLFGSIYVAGVAYGCYA